MGMHFSLLFEHDKYAITERHRETIREIARVFNQNDVPEVEITGHADASGTEPYNRSLSRDRAYAVSQAMIEAGIDPSFLELDWKGEEDLYVETPDGVKERANRRVEITF